MKKITLFIFVFLFLVSGDVMAQGISFSNPFKPALPEKKEQPPPVKPEPIPRIEPKPPIIKPKKIEPPAFDISGLVWNSDLPQAIVNDQIVKIGDVLNNSEIVGISRIGIEIKYKGKYFVIQKKENIMD